MVCDGDDINGLIKKVVDDRIRKTPNKHTPKMTPDRSACVRMRKNELNGTLNLSGK